jgi:hypothetical protein
VPVSKPFPIQGHKYLYMKVLSSILLLPSIACKQQHKKKERKKEGTIDKKDRNKKENIE